MIALEFFDDRMHSDKEIKSLLPVPVLSEVPEVSTAADEHQLRRRAVLGWAMTAAIAVCILIGSTFSYLRS